VPTDPFVAPELDQTPRQAQNVAPGVAIPAAESWHVGRPGDEVSTGQPTGMLLGSPGPNIGYALTLVQRVRDRIALAPGEALDDACAVVGELGMRRAASYGRAPVIHDLEGAMTIFGYQGGSPPDFAAWRVQVVQGAHHDYPRRRALCDAVPIDELRLAPTALSTRLDGIRATLRARVEAAPV
jgi:hypothetical protein